MNEKLIALLSQNIEPAPSIDRIFSKVLGLVDHTILLSLAKYGDLGESPYVRARIIKKLRSVAFILQAVADEIDKS